jgi:RHS repeat-associated protein
MTHKQRAIRYRWFRRIGWVGIIALGFQTAAPAAEAGVRVATRHYRAWQHARQQALRKLPDVRVLRKAEMQHLKGRGRIPSLAGQAKWDIIDNGVNLRTRNYTYTATDLTLPGAIGIPVSVVRTWNANDDREGPFGIGWSWSLDVRQAAGGLIKRKASPSRTVPTQVNNGRNMNIAKIKATSGGPVVQVVQVDGAQCQDAGGEQWIAWRDADGLYTPPPWDHNEYESTYESVLMGTGENQYMRDYAVSTKVTTPDGTVYYYEAVRQPNDTHGNCRPNGSIVAVDNAGNEVYAEQVLKWVEDRHGNRTEYEYVYIDNVYHSYYRSDGSRGTAVVRKAFVKTVRNASGFTLTVDWNFESGGGYEGYEYDAQCQRWWLRYPRVVAVHSSDGRTVRYWYGPEGQEQNGPQNWAGSVTAVQSPGGRITRYGYTTWAVHSNYAQWVRSWGLSTRESWLLQRVYDADGVTFEIIYNTEENFEPYHDDPLRPFIDQLGYAIQVKRIMLPDGSQRVISAPDMGSYFFLSNDRVDTRDCNPENDQRDPWGKVAWRWYQFLTDSNPSNPIYVVFMDCTGGVMRTYDKLTGQLVHEKIEEGPLCSLNFDCSDTNFRCRVPSFMEDASQDDTVNIRWRCELSEYNTSEYNTTEKRYTYNCLGNPVSIEQKIVQGSYLYSTHITEISYWGKERYYQKRLEINTSSVYRSDGVQASLKVHRTFYDYFDRTAPQGYRGMLRAVYADPYSVFDGTGVDSQPSSLDPLQDDIVRPLSRVLEYNSYGQPTLTKALQQVSPIRWVLTQTSYDPCFHQPAITVEDVGGVNRINETLYDDFGRPYKQRIYNRQGQLVRELTTDYRDADGLVQAVRLTHNGQQAVNRRLTSYDYTAAGRVQTSTDHLSNIRSEITYDPSGRPRLYKEFWSDRERYALEYLYDGSDLIEKILTVQGQRIARWKYRNYLSGDILFQRVPTRILFYLGQNSNDNAPDEVVDYLYDRFLRLRAVRFAVTPMQESDRVVGHRTLRQDMVSELLDEQYPKSFAFVWYAYNPDGTLNDLRYYIASRDRESDSFGVYYLNSYSYNMITRFQYFHLQGTIYQPAYDAHGNRLGMYAFNEFGNLVRTETYQYDALDRLTGVSYNNGAWQSWAYDVMGNRYGAGNPAYDGLNRLTRFNGAAIQHDLLGNRLQDGRYLYRWDALNRLVEMQAYQASGWFKVVGDAWRFVYRADGLRVVREKVSLAAVADGGGEGGGSSRTEYLYDGQMPVCEQEFAGSTLRTTRVNFLGARGIEAVVTVDHTRGNQVSLRWLLYDGHGNLVRTMAPDYRLSGFQWRGVWGEVQGSLGAGRGYCANLGHPEDETGLVYMRARYYEPATGRFISEDPARDGVNWYLYAEGNPVNNVDYTGRFTLSDLNISIMIGESLASAGVDALLQYLFTGSVDVREVILAGAVGMVFGGIGAIARRAFYMKSPLHQAVWERNISSFREFWTYFLKFIGIGTETSKRRYHLLPMWRALASGAGSRIFSAGYNLWLAAWFDFEE